MTTVTDKKNKSDKDDGNPSFTISIIFLLLLFDAIVSHTQRVEIIITIVGLVIFIELGYIADCIKRKK